ncbi:hypothetical protein MCEMRE203_00149 [Candidatus Nanopelagicaceae bacterium]
MRTFKTIGIVVAGYVLAMLASAAVVITGADPSGDSGGGVALIALSAYWGYLATKAGYRWFDFLFSAIPIYGIYWIFKIANRIAFLPNKDWEERVV